MTVVEASLSFLLLGFTLQNTELGVASELESSEASFCSRSGVEVEPGQAQHRFCCGWENVICKKQLATEQAAAVTSTDSSWLTASLNYPSAQPLLSMPVPASVRLLLVLFRQHARFILGPLALALFFLFSCC